MTSCANHILITEINMAKSSHRIRISAAPEKVYKALSTADGLKHWFTPDIEGEVAPGKEAVFRHEGRDQFRWKFVEMKPDTISRWECLEGPGASAGTNVLFRIKGEGDTTVVECDHDSWPDGHGAFESCNTLWGILMGRLKHSVETGATHSALK